MTMTSDCVPGPELPAGALDDAWAAYGSTYSVGLMNCGQGTARFVQVRGVSHRQELLRSLLPEGQVRAGWPAVLVPGDPAPGKPPRVRVLVHGHEIGEFTQKETAVTLPLLRALAETEQMLVGSAILHRMDGGHIGAQVHVRPGPSTRWAAGRRPATIR